MPYFHKSDPFIDRARNVCINMFLSTSCTDLIFIDSDIAFGADSILKLLKHDKDIIGGAYRMRVPELRYPVEFKWDEFNNCKDEETGYARVVALGMGFVRIKRSVFERMMQHYDIPKDPEGVIQFFRVGMMFPENQKWYGEDVYFCKRWVDMGGEIFIEPDINFTHSGTHDFRGKFLDYLMNGDAVPNEISGWTSVKELNALAQLASESKSVVEIGSWKGRSTKALLEACKGRVYAVDTWLGTNSDDSVALASYGNIYEEFIKNVGSHPNLIILRGNSAEIAKSFNGNKVDMVFVDADHSYEGCRSDIEAWLPKCQKLICGHDYNYAGVKQAVDEKFENVNVIDTLWWVRL